jgi:hypothetical protein
MTAWLKTAAKEHNEILFKTLVVFQVKQQSLSDEFNVHDFILQAAVTRKEQVRVLLLDQKAI